MNKEEEEIIKEQERNREQMEEIMREIEIRGVGGALRISSDRETQKILWTKM